MDEKINAIAERLRGEPFHMLMNNCILKSIRFRRMCQAIGVSARVVFALVIVRNKRYPLVPYVVWFHGWAEVDGQRVELARPLDDENSCGVLDSEIRPIVGVWI